jgi:outer membrane protein
MKRFIFFIAAIFFMAIALPAQDSVSAVLKTLVHQSFTYFPPLKELGQQAKISEDKIHLAATARQPLLTGTANYLYAGPVPEAVIPTGPNTFRTLQFVPANNFNGGINLAYTLIDFGRTKANILKAKEELQQANYALEFNKTQLAAQVATIYYTIAYLQKALQVQDTVLWVLEENKKTTANRFKNGDALKIDLLTINNTIAIEQNRQLDVAYQLQQQQNLLQYTTGQMLETNTVLPTFNFPLPVTTAEQIWLAAQTNNYEYAMATQKIKQASNDVATAKLNRLPSFNLIGSSGYRNGIQPNINNITFNYAAGIGISVPIYGGGKLKWQTKLAQQTTVQLELALKSLDHQYQKDIQQALLEISSNLAKLQNVDSQVRIAKEALQLAQVRFKNGVSTHIELLNANSNLQRIALAEWQYRYQLCLAKITLARLAGVKYW